MRASARKAMTILSEFGIQTLFTVGILLLFGAWLSLCRRLFCRLLGGAGARILLCTGVLGTPVHELSHAAMCLLFGHQITGMRLFRPSAEGPLGYVYHRYNPRNPYQSVGNFFIGIAPILGGSGVLLLLLYLLLPDVCGEVMHAMVTGPSGAENLLGDYMGRIGGVVLALFSAQAVRQWLWWMFLTFSVMIAGHMEISPADIRTGLRGLLYLLLLLLAVDAVLYMVWPAGLSGLTNGCMTFSCLITGFLTLSAVCATAMVLLAGIGRGVMALCGYRAY